MSVASTLPLLSPLVTKILELSGFPPQLKTRDLQQVFAPYEDDKGGYKIKWVDDTTALIIFADASVAKKAYLRTIMSPPPQLVNESGIPAKIRPYDKDDASAIISSVSNRQRSRSNAGGVLGSPTKQHAELAPAPTTPGSPAKHVRGHSHTPSFGRATGHRRQQSGSNPNLPPKPVAAALFDAANGGPSPANRVLAGVDSLSGIAGLPANPVAAARSSLMFESNRMSRSGSGSSSGADTLDSEMGRLSMYRNASSSSSSNGNGHVNGNGSVRSVSDSSSNDGSMGPPSSVPSNGGIPRSAPRVGEASKRLGGPFGGRLPGLARSAGNTSSSSPAAGNSRTTTPQPATTVG